MKKSIAIITLLTGIITLVVLVGQPFLFWYIWENAGDSWAGRGFMTLQAIFIYLSLRGEKSE